MNKAVTLALILTAAAQPAFACGGGYPRVHAVHMTRVTHVPPKEHAKVETNAEIAEERTTAPAATTGAVNSATVAPSGECKQYFPSVGSLVAVPCGG